MLDGKTGTFPGGRALGCRTVNSGKALAGDRPASFDHLARNNEFFDAFLRRKGIHGVKQQLFQDHHQAARADFSLDRLSRDSLERVFCELELDVIEVEFLLVLLDQSVLWFGKNFYECALVELVQHAAHGQASDKLRDQSESNQ